ncbi:Immunoglobulin G-binding protein H [Tripterygium wilfordii]|uniref:Immunoglobulin G-binding protein H n=1 Tax=Tripterygium wilfordii TaxID=458696 RepID=A0A7J7CLI0_TRIWF|nr:Immunoglobulin G-binding protein H [Tripterygium wilfordii]
MSGCRLAVAFFTVIALLQGPDLASISLQDFHGSNLALGVFKHVLLSRISMVRTLAALDSYSSFTSDLALLAAGCDSSRPSAVAEDEELK